MEPTLSKAVFLPSNYLQGQSSFVTSDLANL